VVAGIAAVVRDALADPAVRAQVAELLTGTTGARRRRRTMSMNLAVILAAVVGVLAAIAVIGALVFVIVWEGCAIRRTLAEHRRHTEQPETLWRNHATASGPGRRP
jgi:hypothetical protein